jgi:hypothetical protein
VGFFTDHISIIFLLLFLLLLFHSRCTHTFATPSLYVDLTASSKALKLNVTTFEVAGYGGAPCSQQLAMQMKDTLNIKRLCVSN